MHKVSGLVLGAGTSAQYIGLGFVPDEVVLQMVDTGGTQTLNRLWWNRKMLRSNVCPEGISFAGNDLDADCSAKTDGNGIIPYYGGDIIATAAAQKVVHLSHPALKDTYGADQRFATAGTTVSKWTKDTTIQGHFNTAVNTTYVGAGSIIIARLVNVEGPLRDFALVALANQGTATNEADLQDEPGAAELDIRYISYMYDFANLPAGYVMPQGIIINETSVFNAASQKFLIEATKW
jgi:hypothetical protein